jgi:hypothetical protein
MTAQVLVQIGQYSFIIARRTDKTHETSYESNTPQWDRFNITHRQQSTNRQQNKTTCKFANYNGTIQDKRMLCGYSWTPLMSADHKVHAVRPCAQEGCMSVSNWMQTLKSGAGGHKRHAGPLSAKGGSECV